MKYLSFQALNWILYLVDGNMGMQMMANVGQCVGDVQSFIGMIMSMDMDVKVNIDYEIDYSPENIQKAIEVS